MSFKFSKKKRKSNFPSPKEYSKKLYIHFTEKCLYALKGAICKI